MASTVVDLIGTLSLTVNSGTCAAFKSTLLDSGAPPLETTTAVNRMTMMVKATALLLKRISLNNETAEEIKSTTSGRNHE